MKLSDRKIDSLSQKIVAWLAANPEIELLGSVEAVRAAVATAFLDEKQIERKLDEDVEVILQQNEGRMRNEGVDPWLMRKKIRQQLARERGLVL